jgi:hypothetical protein
MLGLIYKLGCIVTAVAGLVVAFPLGAYGFIMGVSSLNSGGLLIFLVILAPAAAVVWAILHSAFRFKSAALSSFVAPTVAAALGVAFVAVGLPFAQNPPGY